MSIFTAPEKEVTAQQMSDCLPIGKVWDAKNIDESNVRKLINSLALAHNNTQQKVEELAYEFNINNTTQLIDEWEVSVGIPDT